MIFLIIHLKSFWYEMHFGEIVMDSWGNKDLHSVTIIAFEQLWYVIFYVLSMIVLALHLKHGVESAFQTLGVKTRLNQSIIHKVAYFFSFAIPALFAIIPIYIFWKQL
jgi:succinate dehydrogenase / fumarate reductase cytochrome b subunit